jgi:hypothetical protein
VTIDADAGGAGLAVLSDVPLPAGEALTLYLLSAAGRQELRATVIATEPHVVNGSVRHRLRLAILHVSPAVPDTTPEY